MADSPAPKKHTPGQERLLADYIQRLDNYREGRSVVHIHLSALRPSNRRDSNLRTAASSFEPVIKAEAGRLFLLENGDIFFFFKDEVRGEVETAVGQVRHMFSDDPLVTDEAEMHTVFAAWFHLAPDFNEIRKIVQVLADAEDRRREDTRSRMDARASLRAKQKMGEPLTPEVLARIEDALAQADLTNLVRRQYACSIDTSMVPDQKFSELFISIQDLRETLLPDVNLLSNQWLFRHLTETLDRRMLSMLGKTDYITISGNISFNINIRTLMSQDFKAFNDSIAASRRGSMIIELQKEDLFADLGAYLFIREFVQSSGYQVAIDGMTFEAMQLMDLPRLGADIIKLVWSNELMDGGGNVHARIRQLVASMGEAIDNKVVLCRCDTREAVDFGHSIGIHIFQGRYIESLIAEDNKRQELMRIKRRMEHTKEQDIKDFIDTED